MDFTTISFLVLSLTGLLIMSFGSLGTWLLCEMMEVTKWTLLIPIFLGAIVVWGAIVFFLK